MVRGDEMYPIVVNRSNNDGSDNEDDEDDKDAKNGRKEGWGSLKNME